MRGQQFAAFGGGVAYLIPDNAAIRNGGFEDADGDRLIGWHSQSAPGRATIADTATKAAGRQSMRLPASGAESGKNRLSQWFEVTPWRQYRVSAYVRTEGLDPTGAFGMTVRGETPAGMRDLTYWRFSVSSNQDWMRIDAVFNSLDAHRAILHVGLWGARNGTLWIDEVSVTETAFVNLIRRDGAPLTVRTADGACVLVEGVAFDRLVDPGLGQASPWPGRFDRWHEPPALTLKIVEPWLAHLSVDYYHAQVVNATQVDICVSEAEAHAITYDMIRRLHRVFAPAGYVLGYNELRQGGGCARCAASGLTVGELLRKHVAHTIGMIEAIDPDARAVTWSDLFDPYSNAVDRYYLILGTLRYSWAGLPDGLGIMQWTDARRPESMRHFAELGRRQVLSVNFDAGTAPTDPLELWRMLNSAPGVSGVMFTTWAGSYGRLRDVADATSRPRGDALSPP